MPSRSPSGILAASLTPYHADLSPNYDAFADHVHWLLENGCDGALLFGTTGEGLSLTVAERQRGLDAVLARDLSAQQILVGTGALPLPDAVELTRAATERDVGGVLVLPPFHFRQIRPEGVFRFYDRLIQEVGDSALRLYFYHFPELSGVPIPFTVVQRLQEAYPEQIAGIKDSSAEWDHTQALCEAFPDLQVFTGTERLLLPILNAGGSGCISGTANVTAPLAARVLDEWRQNKAPEDAQERLTSLRTAFAPLPTIPALKHLLSQRRTAPDWASVRPPLLPLDEDEKRSVDDIEDLLQEEIDVSPLQR